METQLIKSEDEKVLRHNTCGTSDYLIAIGCGAISGLVDIFFVGAPGESLLGSWTDMQVDTVVKKFARMNGWVSAAGKEDSAASAIGYLERKFAVNYDQRYSADVDGLFSMSTKNHHIKSLAHSPDIVGLFFSILNQFTSTASFVGGGKLITIKTEDFELQGGNFVAKLFCGVTNWLGHIMSDIAGSSGSRGNSGRGTGVAIPFFELFQFCSFGKFSVGKDKQDLATLAVRVFQEGYDARFGVTMAIPVVLCDLMIRLLWVLKGDFYLKKPLEECVPNSTHSDLRMMLIFGNGTLCLMDGADAAIRSGGNWLAFFTRMNIIAWVRFITLVLKEICIRLGISSPLQKQLDAYKRINASLQSYLSQLQAIDIVQFQKETEQYNLLLEHMDQIEDEGQLNIVLRYVMVSAGINLPWEGEFDTFMGNKEAHLVFE